MPSVNSHASLFAFGQFDIVSQRFTHLCRLYVQPSVHTKNLCAQLLLLLKRDYDQHFTNGRR